MKQARGFTLIEIAVVLFIVSLLIGAITTYVTAQVTAAKLALTQTRQAAIKAALTNFISRNNRLPCPANPTLASTAAGNGVEGTNPGTCTGAIFGLTVSTGAVPWSSLGLTSDAAFDGYNNRFTYIVTLAATNLNAQTVMGMKGVITVHSAGPGVVASPSATPAGNQLNDCRADLTVAYTSAANPCAAVVAVISHGPDGFGAYTDAGVQTIVPGTATDTFENANADSKVVTKQYTDAAANPFDDIVLTLTPNDLISGLTTGGGMQSALATVNTNFNLIKSAVISYAVQNRTGSFVCVVGTCTATANCATPGQTCETTSFTYTILPPTIMPDAADPTGNPIPTALGLPASVTNDPWGSSIRYVRTPANATITSAAPAASAEVFRLRSAGPDGTLGNTDDIFIIVTVGELRSQFSKF